MAQHLSIRIPWHDNKYCGKVCKNPCRNMSCLRLKNIYKNRDDSTEESLQDKDLKGHETDISCLSEDGAFMSNDTYEKLAEHPYSKSSQNTHGHFLPTKIIFPPYSLPTTPFAWLMKKDNSEKLRKERYNVTFDEMTEPTLPFQNQPIWIQEIKNQRATLDYFYHAIEPNKSLCIIYAKQVPFIEDSRRVIMGIGYITEYVPSVEYESDGTNDFKATTWESMIRYSIREDFKMDFYFHIRN